MKFFYRSLLLVVMVVSTLFAWPAVSRAACCECLPPVYDPNTTPQIKRTCVEKSENLPCESVCANYGPSPYPTSSSFCDSNNCPTGNTPGINGGCCVWINQENKALCINASEGFSELDCYSAANSSIQGRNYYDTKCINLEYCKVGYEFPGRTDDSQNQSVKKAPVQFIPQVTIPGSITIGGKVIQIRKGEGIPITGDTAAQYFAVFYKFFIAALAVIAVVMVMWGGFKRIMAAGSPEAVKSANETILGAITGVVIALISYSLLSLINPALVSFKTLKIDPIVAEEFYLRPAFIENIGNPEFAKTADEFSKLPCPSEAELLAGVEFFTTGYYKPNYGDKEKYPSFWCNIAMQCSCPNDAKEAEYSCQAGNIKWRPCQEFGENVPYCNEAKYGRTPPPPRNKPKVYTKEPEPWVTVAQQGCLSPGTVIKVFGSKQGGVSTAEWYVHDIGGAITGRRIDLFFGQGPTAYQQALNSTGVVIVKKCPNNNVNLCPSS